MLEQWLLGFLSGVGFGNSSYDPLRGIDAEAVWAWVDNYCRNHPLDTVTHAAGYLLAEHPR